jgi:hypothetical protein
MLLALPLGVALLMLCSGSRGPVGEGIGVRWFAGDRCSSYAVGAVGGWFKVERDTGYSTEPLARFEPHASLQRPEGISMWQYVGLVPVRARVSHRIAGPPGVSPLLAYWITETADVRQVAVPLWMVMAAAIVYPVLWARRVIRERVAARRASEGRCTTCGYDLRASAGRCPECGMETISENNPPGFFLTRAKR